MLFFHIDKIWTQEICHYNHSFLFRDSNEKETLRAIPLLRIAARVKNLEQRLPSSFGVDQFGGVLVFVEEPLGHEVGDVVGLQWRDQAVEPGDPFGEGENLGL